jgi:serine/threonine-protein kinase
MSVALVRGNAGGKSQLGRRVGSYRLLRKLGEGGMGEVYLAVHEQLDRQVALKVLRAEHASDPHHVERFVREAWIANRVRHENVVDVTDLAFLPDGRPYVVMEYIEDGTLYSLWDQERGMDLLRFLDAGIQIASALSAAHRASIVHRDIKPANVFLTPRGVKIADFGLSKVVASDPGDTFTKSGIVMATPPYMSPEQATGEPIDGRSDIYSLGVTMWELLVGRRPFRALAFGEYVVAHATRAVEPPSQAGASMVPGGIPAELDAVVMRCLAKRREERFASAEEVRAALARLREQLAGREGGAGPTLAWRRLVFLPAAVTVARLRRGGLVLGGALLLCILGGIAARSVRTVPAAARASVAAGVVPVARPPVVVPVPAALAPVVAVLPEPPSAPARPFRMEGLGLVIPRTPAPRRRHDAVDRRTLKDPFGGG